MTDTPADEHGWFQRHMVAFEAGLLDDEGSNRFLTHRDGCDSCQRIWQAFVAPPGVEGDVAPESQPNDTERHIAAAMIARWDRARSSLKGVEREMVAHHLARCAQCREDLVAAGFEPELDAEHAPSSATPAPAPEAVGAPKVIELQPSRSWRTWLWGAVSGAVVATAAALLIITVVPDRQGGDGDPLLPWVAPSRVRGGAMAAVDLPAEASRVGITLGVPRDVDVTLSAEVTVTGPEDQVLLNATIAPDALARRTVIVVLEAPGALAPGTYRVVFRQAAAGVVDETHFEVTTSRKTGPD